MDKLSQVIYEIRRVVFKTRSDFTEHLCWRLHPDDMLVVMEQAKKYASERQHPWLPLGDFYLLGVRIFADERAPKLKEPT